MPDDPPQQGWVRGTLGRHRSLTPPPVPTKPPGTTSWKVGVVPSQLNTGNTHAPAPPPVIEPPKPTPPTAPLPTIVSGQIAAIEAISEGHPVFLVTLKSDAKVVVKVDSMAKSTLVRGNKRLTDQNAFTINELMMSVNPGADSIPISDSEFDALAAFALAPPDFGLALQQVRTGQGFILKMAQAQGFTTFGYAMKRELSTNDKAKFNNLIQKLRNNRDAWMSMGQVCAVDLFVGNGDRVWFEQEVIGNAGNMIFQQDSDGKIRRALGYDNLDPNSPDMSVMYGTVNLDQWEQQFGRFLKDIRGYGRRCQNIFNNFNQRILAPLGIDGLLPNDASSLAAGMEQGHNILARKISDKVKLGMKVPSGVMYRARYLGWVR